jgi:hypothetical protein
VDHFLKEGASSIYARAGMQKLVNASAALSRRPEFSAVQKLKSIDVISVRLWLDRKIDFQFPANVLAGFEKEAGSTFFDLNALQVFLCCTRLSASLTTTEGESGGNYPPHM